MKKSVYILCALTACIMCFSFLFGVKKIPEKKQGVLIPKQEGIITLWHVDTFEGGTGSRRRFLFNVAAGFEKRYKNVLIMVSNYTPDGITEALKSGLKPDMISYGVGVDVNNLQTISTDDNLKYSAVGKTKYGACWCRGCYVLMVKEGYDNTEVLPEIIVSQGKYTQPLTAFALSGYTAEKIKTVNPSDAFSEFINGKTPYFVGTQRDVVRLSYKNVAVRVYPLLGYNDLYQYVSVVTENDGKRYYCNKYIEYLLSDAVQKKLVSLNMFSQISRADYTDGIMTEMQNAVFEKGISAYTFAGNVYEMQTQALLAAAGDKTALAKLQNSTF